MPPFISTAPRPKSWPSAISPAKGACDQPFTSPAGTTSVCPAKTMFGAPVPMRA
jgi:hypothetical protein